MIVLFKKGWHDFLMTEETKNTDIEEPQEDTPTEDVRVFLVVVDQETETRAALRYASNRAKKTGGKVALLAILEPVVYDLMGIGNIMADEAREQAEMTLQRTATNISAMTGEFPILYTREGEKLEAVLELLEEEPSIQILVLASNPDTDDPGPLVTALTGKNIRRLGIPFTIVPGNLSDEEIDALT